MPTSGPWIVKDQTDNLNGIRHSQCPGSKDMVVHPCFKICPFLADVLHPIKAKTYLKPSYLRIIQRNNKRVSNILVRLAALEDFDDKRRASNNG